MSAHSTAALSAGEVAHPPRSGAFAGACCLSVTWQAPTDEAPTGLVGEERLAHGGTVRAYAEERNARGGQRASRTAHGKGRTEGRTRRTRRTSGLRNDLIPTRNYNVRT